MRVIDNVAPCKTKQIKRNTQNWFDREVIEKLKKTFKKTRLHIEKRLNTMHKS